jgi:hypothetical protein
MVRARFVRFAVTVALCRCGWSVSGASAAQSEGPTEERAEQEGEKNQMSFGIGAVIGGAAGWG